MAEVRAQGYRVGYAPYGYRHSTRLDAHGRRILEQDPTQQEGLRRILALFDAGKGAKRIAAILTAEHVPKGRGGAWYDEMIYRILRREGRMPQPIRAEPIRRPVAVIVRDRNSVSEEARKLRSQGLSLRQIGRRLSSLGYGPPRGTRWHASTIATLLDAEEAA